MKHIKEKFEAFEATPPANGWERLQLRLDGDEGNLRNKLENYQTPPPAGLWNKIEAKLPGDTERRPVRRLFPRVAAAAAILLVLAVGSVFYFNRSSEPATAAVQVPTPTEIPGQKPSANLPSERPTIISQPRVEEKQIIAAASPSRSERQRRQVANPQWLEGEIDGSVFQYLPAPEENIILPANTTEKYSVLLDGDGQSIRLSKKLYEEFQCATREAACRQKIRQLQSKLSATAVDSDFTSLMDLIQGLGEKP